MLMRGLLIALLILAVPPQSQLPFPAHVESPDYPLDALHARVEGDVEVTAEVDSQGRVIGPQKATKGHLLLRDAAEENIRTWRFQPGAQGKVKVTYRYRILGRSMYGAAPTKYKFDLPDSVTVIAMQGGLGGSLSSMPRSDVSSAVPPLPTARSAVHLECIDTYPPLARQARIAGDVVLFAKVDSTGQVIGWPELSSGHPLLVQPAIENLRTWRFQPDGKPELKVTYHFRVDGPPTDYPSTSCEFDLPDSATIITSPPVVNWSATPEPKSK